MTTQESVTREGCQESEALPIQRCGRCRRPRFTVRTSRYEVHREDVGQSVPVTGDICRACRAAVGAELAAPEATTPSIIDIATARVELVEAKLTHPEQLAAVVGAGAAPEGDLPYVWPEPEVVS